MSKPKKPPLALSPPRPFSPEIYRESLRSVLNTPQGRAVIWGILQKCCIWHSHSDLRTEGRRDMGLQLWTEVERLAPEAFLQMLLEFWNTTRRASEAPVQDADDDGGDDE